MGGAAPSKGKEMNKFIGNLGSINKYISNTTIGTPARAIVTKQTDKEEAKDDTLEEKAVMMMLNMYKLCFPDELVDKILSLERASKVINLVKGKWIDEEVSLILKEGLSKVKENSRYKSEEFTNIIEDAFGTYNVARDAFKEQLK